MDEYLIPTQDSEAEFIEKRSRFIGRIWHVETEEAAIACIKKMREQHWDATHNVYAYISIYLPVPYNWYERMKLEVANYEGIIRDTQFGMDVELEVLTPTGRTQEFLDRVVDISAGTLEGMITGQEYRAFPVNL